ncbi:MAG: CRISPR-associated protein Cas5t [Bacillota bacterium]|nr:CRISPR-associated protein Cas5t [Bacillota bacterium]
MISAVRIVLAAYSASFRVPGFLGYQLTIPVPPLSTIYGLISAAAGRWVLPSEVEWLAYRCEYESKAMDLEAIITVARSNPTEAARLVGRNVLRREFLVMPRLTLYLPPAWGGAFRRPRYHLLLGRTQDVAGVESITPVTLEPVDEGEVGGVLLPLELLTHGQNRVDGWLHNLPLAFTSEPYRQLLGMKIFGVVDARRGPSLVRTPGWLVRDATGGTAVPIYRREWVEEALRGE